MRPATLSEERQHPGDPAEPAAANAWPRVPPHWRMPIVVFCWVQLVLLGWWAGQWPGLLSYDSVVYVIHVTTGPWVANHSVLYDSLVLGSVSLTHNVWLLTLAQTTAWAAALAYFAASVREWGVRGRWAAIPALALPLIPSFGGFVAMVWKDVPFALAEVMLTATVLRVARRWRADPAQRRVPGRLLVAIGAELVALAMFRPDGFVMVVVVTVVLVLVFRGLRLRLLACGVVALLTLVVSNTLIYPAAGIHKANSSLTYGTVFADIALVYHQSPGSFTPADTALMARVAPLSHWAAADNCYDSDPLYRTGWNYAEGAALEQPLLRLWARTLAREPVEMIAGRLCRSAIAWDPLRPPPDQIAFATLPTHVPYNLYGHLARLPGELDVNLQSAPLVGVLGTATHWLRVHTTSPVLAALIWRGATWCYLAYLALLIAAVRRRRKVVLTAGVVCLANQLMVLAANPNQLYRYIVGPIFIGMLLVPMAFVRPAPDARDPATESEDEPAGSDVDVAPPLVELQPQ